MMHDTRTTDALTSAVQASRNTGCCADIGYADYDLRDTLTPMERIAYWASVGAAVGISLVAVFGTAGYLYAKAVGL